MQTANSCPGILLAAVGLAAVSLAALVSSQPGDWQPGQTGPIRQRKLHLYPSYDIIQDEKEAAKVDESLRFNNMAATFERPPSSAKSRPKQLTKHSALRSRQNVTAYDADINTLSALIKMLTTANQRLIEERERSRLNSTGEPGGLPLAALGTKQRLAAIATSTGQSPASANYSAADSNRSLSQKWARANEQLDDTQSAQDLILVRPGFDHLRAAPASGSGSESGSAAAKQPGEQQAAQFAHPAYARNPFLVHEAPPSRSHHGLHQHQPYPPIEAHKPTRAHDLLHVRTRMGHEENPMYVSRGYYGGLAAPVATVYDQQDKPPLDSQLMVPPYNTLDRHALARQSAGGDMLAAFRPPSELNRPHQPPMVSNNHRHHDQFGGNQPMQQMMAAEKGQQDFEQRRLEFEHQLRRKQEALRRKHELEVMKQRKQAAKEAAKSGRQMKSYDKNKDKDKPKEKDKEPEKDAKDADPKSNDVAGDQEQNQNQDQTDGPQQQQQQQEEQQQEPNQFDQEEQDDGSGGQFGADADLADMLPAGIFSKAEIEDMRRQQREQERQQQQRDDEANQENQVEPDAENQDNQEQQQQQQEQQPNEDQASQNNNTGDNKQVSEPKEEKPALGANVTSVASELTKPAQDQKGQPSGPEHPVRANKTRRSWSPDLMPIVGQPTGDDINYIKPFLSTARQEQDSFERRQDLGGFAGSNSGVVFDLEDQNGQQNGAPELGGDK